MIRAQLDKLLTVVIAGVLAGLVLAAAALPAALVFGIGFSALSTPYSELPNTLRTPPTAQRSNLYANDGTTLITSFYQEDRVDVPLHEVAPVMRQAIVAAEDVRFYQHSGVDLRGVVRAFTVNKRDGRTRQGASTLTMQYVRNVLSNDPRLTEAQRAPPPKSPPSASSRRCGTRSRWSGSSTRRRSSPATSTSPTSAPGRTASRRPASGTSPVPGRADPGPGGTAGRLVRSPDSDDPINGDADSAVARRSYVLERLVESGQVPADAAAAARRRTVATAAQRDPERLHGGARRRTTTGASSATGSPAGGAASPRSARPPTSGSARCAGAGSPSCRRWTRGCSGPPPSRC